MNGAVRRCFIGFAAAQVLQAARVAQADGQAVRGQGVQAAQETQAL